MDIRAFLQQEVKPALGCTETGAVALAAAAAARRLANPAKSIRLGLSANIYKNGKNVGVPGAVGLTGNLVAAALGAVAGDPEKGLESLSGVTKEDVGAAQALLQGDRVAEKVVDDVPDVYVEAEVFDGTDKVAAIISGRHDHLAEVRKNGEQIFTSKSAVLGFPGRPAYMDEFMKMDMNAFWKMSSQMDADTMAYLLEGVEMNRKISEYGLSGPVGLGIGYTLKEKGVPGDLLWEIKAATAAAADARLAGEPYPVMSSGGSGNHGIVAILAPYIVARANKASDEELAAALLLSHLLTGFFKAHTGRLSPVCGCALAAGVGAAGAMVMLGKGTPDQAESAAASILGSILGMVCDGAKGSCALKVSAAAGEAYISAILALSGRGVDRPQGVLPLKLPQLADTVGTLSKIGLSNMDPTIIRLMENKAPSLGRH